MKSTAAPNSGLTGQDSLTQAATVNPMALSVEEAARLLGLSPETVRGHVARGLPTDSEGRINLVQYAAWLNGELARGD